VVLKEMDHRKYKKYFLIFGWILPAFQTAVPLIAGKFGPRDLWYVVDVASHLNLRKVLD
jgi:hypothetical protein